jgi:hypothetical protein
MGGRGRPRALQRGKVGGQVQRRKAGGWVRCGKAGGCGVGKRAGAVHGTGGRGNIG